MGLERSKYLRKPKAPKNPWREIVLSHDILRSALEATLRQYRAIKPDEIVDKVIVGETHDHKFSLSVAVCKEGGAE